MKCSENATGSGLKRRQGKIRRVACFARQRHLMKFSWQIFPMTDVQTEEGCCNTQLYFSSQIYHEVGLWFMSKQEAKRGYTNSNFTEMWICKESSSNHNTGKWGLWKATHRASAQFGVKKIIEGPLSWASRPYRPFSSQKMSLGYQLLHL